MEVILAAMIYYFMSSWARDYFEMQFDKMISLLEDQPHASDGDDRICSR